MSKLRLGILLSGSGRTLVNIAECIEAGQLDAQIVSVISSRSDVVGVERSRSVGIEPQIVRRKDFADIAAFSFRIAAIMDAHNVDLILQCGWLCLWQIPSQYKNKVMNIHPGLLPEFGGKGMYGHFVHDAVIAAGKSESGCTVHFVNNEYDAGPIILQRSCPVFADDDGDTLAERVFQQECIAYPQAIKLFSEGRLEIENGKVKII